MKTNQVPTEHVTALRVEFLGLVGSGKSHLARVLAQRTGGKVLAYAEGVYRLAELVKGSPVDKTDSADRELLKRVGTSWGREGHPLAPELERRVALHKPRDWGSPDIWARLFIERCNAVPPGTNIFNDDTRFENELRISTREAGFIPVFVKTTESTRLTRLLRRGDEKDANDPAHTSELLTNFLNPIVIDQHLLPVVWNDATDSKPDRCWVWSVNSFTRLVESCTSNADLAVALNWNQSHEQRLLDISSAASARLSADLVRRSY